MSSLLKNILFALGLAVILWLGYKLFFAKDDTPISIEDATIASQASQETAQFLATLQQLQDIKLDEGIFSDGRLQSLVDYRQTIIDEPVGRSNPFAPLGQ